MSGPTPQMIQRARVRASLLRTAQYDVAAMAALAPGRDRVGAGTDWLLDDAIRRLLVGSHGARDGWAR